MDMQDDVLHVAIATEMHRSTVFHLKKLQPSRHLHWS